MNNKDIKILIVDDDEQLQEVYKTAFEALGFIVIQAWDAKETLKVLKSVKPSIILLDILMPEIDGKELLARIKKVPSFKKIPVFVTSNSVKEEDIQETKKLGAEEYIVKSNISIEELMNKILKTVKK